MNDIKLNPRQELVTIYIDYIYNSNKYNKYQKWYKKESVKCINRR